MNDVDISRNIFYLTGDITESTVPYFISRVNYLVEENKDREILVYINSYGGDMYSAFGIIDYMRVCEVKIGMACYGAATSAAALILISATGEIVMSKNSYLMFHPPWINDDEEIDEKHMENLKEKVIEIIMKRSILQDWGDDVRPEPLQTKEFWEKKLNKEFYLSAHECLKMRLIQRVLSY